MYVHMYIRGNCTGNAVLNTDLEPTNAEPQSYRTNIKFKNKTYNKIMNFLFSTSKI